MPAPRGLRNAVVMIQSSGPSFCQFAELNQCVLTTLMELRSSEWRDLLAWACSYQLKETLYRAIHTLNLWTAEKLSLWLDVMHQEATAAMPWLRDFEAEWLLTVAWRRIDGTYPATLIRLK
ncbi:hypothetical protein DFH09DRAFT_1318297 [Mycena vulgaris]|nr:hypothetical protein DFH09DRAFT_1318297 [Mycena vulgaris]